MDTFLRRVQHETCSLERSDYCVGLHGPVIDILPSFHPLSSMGGGKTLGILGNWFEKKMISHLHTSYAIPNETLTIHLIMSNSGNPALFCICQVLQFNWDLSTQRPLEEQDWQYFPFSRRFPTHIEQTMLQPGANIVPFSSLTVSELVRSSFFL